MSVFYMIIFTSSVMISGSDVRFIVPSLKWALYIKWISVYHWERDFKKILFTSVVDMYTNRKAFILRLSFISILLDQKYHLRSNTNILFTARILFFRFNYDPSVQIPAKTFENPKVSGQNRYKYFRRPIIPFLQQVPPEVLLQPTT